MNYRALVVGDDERSAEVLRVGDGILLTLNLLPLDGIHIELSIVPVDERILFELSVTLDPAIRQL